MGLDMYLSGSKYISKINWDEEANLALAKACSIDTKTYDTIIEITNLKEAAIGDYGARVEVTCAYWRKANQIHKWFVDNVQNGNDNCGDYYVNRSKLIKLRDLCRQASDNKDPHLLPPQPGFFFGSYDIDEGYWSDIENTIEQLDRVLSLPEDISFSYQSSW